MAQNYTFQGIPWGTSKEQVIAKLGKPTYERAADFSDLWYENVLIAGYRATLCISTQNGMSSAEYRITETFSIYSYWQAYQAIVGELQNKYGNPSQSRLPLNFRVFTQEDPYFAIWHFMDFHIFFMLGIDSTGGECGIGYCSDAVWATVAENLAGGLADFPPTQDHEL
jgi:hypothetical protein